MHALAALLLCTLITLAWISLDQMADPSEGEP